MWQKADKKTIFTLNVDDYAPEITSLTYPLIEHYAKRIGADWHVIDQRKFPGWPVVYEKLQVYELAQQMENDWNLYVDSDALIHPETIDFTLYLPRDTVAHTGSDLASIRWTYDRFFRRDGRNIGSCNWFAIASDWCIDLWKPLDDLTLKEAVANIQPTVGELTTIVTPEHLIDDYVLSRNIAQFGLKFTTVKDILKNIGLPDANFFFHLYTISIEEKIEKMKETLDQWNIAPWRAKRAQGPSAQSI